jgi:hypothetical protein
MAMQVVVAPSGAGMKKPPAWRLTAFKGAANLRMTELVEVSCPPSFSPVAAKTT